jgi:hypothetical protein
LTRVVKTIRSTAHVVVGSIVLELVLDFGAGAAAVVLAPYVGRWVYAVAGIVVVGSIPVLSLNIARIARREWRRHHPANYESAAVRRTVTPHATPEANSSSGSTSPSQPRKCGSGSSSVQP